MKKSSKKSEDEEWTPSLKKKIDRFQNNESGLKKRRRRRRRRRDQPISINDAHHSTKSKSKKGITKITIKAQRMKKSSKKSEDEEWTPRLKKKIVRFQKNESGLKRRRRRRSDQPISKSDAHHSAKSKSNKEITNAYSTSPGKSGMKFVEKISREEKSAPHSITSTSQMSDEDDTRYQTQIIPRDEERATTESSGEIVGPISTQLCSTSSATATPPTLVPIDMPLAVIQSNQLPSFHDAFVRLNSASGRTAQSADTDMNIQTPVDYYQYTQEFLRNILKFTHPISHIQEHLFPNMEPGQIIQHPLFQYNAVTQDKDHIPTRFQVGDTLISSDGVPRAAENRSGSETQITTFQNPGNNPTRDNDCTFDVEEEVEVIEMD